MSRQQQKPIVDPGKFVSYALGEKLSQLKDHHSVLWCLDDEVYHIILPEKKPENNITDLSGELSLFPNRPAIAGKSGIGSPACVGFLEEMIACGFSRFVVFGSAGALNDEIGMGDIILCTGDLIPVNNRNSSSVPPLAMTACSRRM